MNESYDAVVIGAGIVGVSTALHLLMRGMKVALIDRREPGTETSFGNAGIIGNAYVLPFGFPSLGRIPSILLDRDVSTRVHYSSLPRYLTWLWKFYLNSQTEARYRSGRALWPLISPSLEEHRALMRGTSAEQKLSPDGRTALYRSDESFESDAGSRAMAKELNVPFDVMDTDMFGTIEPHVKPIYRKAVRWSSSWRIKDPGGLVSDYAARFVREGGTFLQTEVKRLDYAESKSWRIAAGNIEIYASHAAICVGPWANDLLKPLGYTFPLAFKRGYHRHYRAMGSAELSHAIVDVDIGYLLSPMEQGYRLTTGAELAALNDPPTPVQIDHALPHARELFPLGDAADDKTWMGSRPCFADSLPAIGPAQNHKGLWFNFGHGHVGMTIGPSSGRLLTEMIRGEKTFCDPQPFSAARFA